jgi:hypothetical protein
MLDIIGILFTTLLMLAVIVKAVRQDRVQPWFATPRKRGPGATAAAVDAKRWQRAKTH